LDSRERTFNALEHQAADRIPIDFWATPSVIHRLEVYRGKPYASFLDDNDVDFRYIEGPAYIGPPLPEGMDIWGVERASIVTGPSGNSESYSEVAKAPLSSAQCPEDIEAYLHWPKPEMFDYSVVERQCDSVLKEKRVVVFMGDRLNRVAQLKPAMYLRGTKNIFVDLAVRKDITEMIFRKIKEFYLAYLEDILRAARGKIDIVLTGDDFGAQNSLLISPQMWRKFIKPGFAEYLALIKRYDALSMHHSCGSVVDIIPDMIDSGLDVLQSLQPEAKGMSIGDLKSKFGKQLCFQGGISIQKTMPYGSVEDVRHEVKKIAETFKSDGGYIFCTSHNIQADTPTENILALMEAYHKYGKC
jgi:uroporphyrinogen decarboxylase